jgi:hypothetical protein
VDGYDLILKGGTVVDQGRRRGELAAPSQGEAVAILTMEPTAQSGFSTILDCYLPGLITT